MTEQKPVLVVRNLTVEFRTEDGTVRAVDDVSFDVGPGETVGVVGESGCGKTVTAMSILGLIPSPPGKIVAGSIALEGQDLVGLPESRLRKIRGKKISMIFQEPMTALNPVFTIGNQMTSVLRRHKQLSSSEARNEAISILNRVRIPHPERQLKSYPHELSGGMRQRVMIAMALSCSPQLLLADEPTTAVDVTTQVQVLEEMNRLQREFHMAMILVTHDLGVIAETCQRVLVMYCGRLVEMASVGALFDRPRHPYTKGLMESIPRIRSKKVAVLPTIDGMVPNLARLPLGCYFADRCGNVQARCRVETPSLEPAEGESRVACFYPES